MAVLNTSSVSKVASARMVLSNWGCSNWIGNQNTEIGEYYIKWMGLRGLVRTARPLAQKIVVHVAEGSLGIVEPEVHSSYDPVVLTVLYAAVVSAYC